MTEKIGILKKKTVSGNGATAMENAGLEGQGNEGKEEEGKNWPKIHS
jgi:hypothetical protein